MTDGREPASAVAGLAGVGYVIDVEDDRVVDQVGLDDPEALEILLHFTGTWRELLEALLPVLGDALDADWAPGRWWACAGGSHVAIGREGRAVVVERGQEGAFLAAVADGGVVDGVKVW